MNLVAFFYIFDVLINLLILGMEFNFLIVFMSALVPVFLGAVWYGPLFRTAWLKEVNFTEKDMINPNMPLIIVLSYILGIFISLGLLPVVIHQMGITSTLANEPGIAEKTGEAYETLVTFMQSYGGKFRTFKHGALHGGLCGFFMIFPIISIKSLFERKSFKYIAINSGYWIICLAIMGGIICKWA